MKKNSYVPLSRGLIEHLPEMGGTALQIYTYLLIRAKYNGIDKGKISVGIKEIAGDLKMHYNTVYNSIKDKLDKKYLLIIPAKNQHNPTEFTILKYKTVQDYKKTALTPDSNGTCEGECNGTCEADVKAVVKQPPETPVNKENPKPKEVKKEKKLNKDNKNLFILPEYINHELWDELLKHRKKRKAPNSDRALMAIINKISALMQEGHKPNALLEKILERGWLTIEKDWLQTNNQQADDGNSIEDYHRRKTEQAKL